MHVQSHLLPCLAIVLTLSSCVPQNGSDLTATPLQQIELNSSLQDSYNCASVKEGEWIEKEWWQLFADPQLTSLIEQALQENLTLKAAIARKESAQRVIESAKARYFPEIGFNLSHSVTRYSRDSILRQNPTMPKVINQTDMNLDFTYELDLFGKNSNLVRAAVGEAKMVEAESSQARLIVTTLIAQSYFSLQANALSSSVYKDILKNRARENSLITERKNAGLDGQKAFNDSLQQQLAVDLVLERLQQEKELLIHQINALLGRGPDQELALEFSLSPQTVKIPIPTTLSIDLIARRPDLSVKIAQTEIAAGELGVARSAFFPNINLAAFLGLSSIHIDKFLKSSSFSAGAAPALHLPIFSAGRIQAQYDAKFSALQAAILDYNEHVLQAAADVANRLSDAQKVEKQFELHERQLKLQQSSTQLAKERYENGVDSLLQFLKEEQALQLEIAQQIELYKAKQMTLVGLIKALGGGYNTPKESGVMSNE